MSTPIANNTAGLRELLQQAQALPEAGSGGVGFIANYENDVNMSGIYQSRTVRRTFSQPGGTADERLDFLEDVVRAMADMGAQFNADCSRRVFYDLSYLELIVFYGDSVPTDYLEPYVCLRAAYNSSDGDLSLSISGANASTDGSNYIPDFSWYRYCKADSTQAEITIHAVKSGDSFFFGFLPAGASSDTAGCINYAITPFKRLSDPEFVQCYAFLVGAFEYEEGEGTYYWYGGTAPYVEGIDYKDFYLFRQLSTSGMFPFNGEQRTVKKTMLTPVFSGMNDFYLENVYLSNWTRVATADETAIKTDTGVYLIGGLFGEDYSAREDVPCQMMFDITQAVNGAMEG